MFKNYFKTVLRNLIKNKSFSLINITGLATGLTCCLLLTLYLQHELSFDRFHSKGERIARVIMDYKIGGSGSKGNFTSTKVLPAFKANFPEVEDGVRMSPTSRLVKYDEKAFIEKNFLYADSTFFNLFDFKLLQGNAAEVLKAPMMVVITKSTAQKYFNNENPVGKSILIGSQQDNYLVTGVTEDCPSNSQLKFDFLASFSSFGPAQTDVYWNANFTTYLLLNNKNSFATLQSKIGPFMKKEFADQKDVSVNFELEPFNKIHLFSPYDAITPNNNIVYVYIIIGVALLILIIACFTYINLSTARSVERAREVGIRKVSGAHRLQVFMQFISESLIITTVSLLISVVAAWFLLPSFNNLAQTGLQFNNIIQPEVISVSLLLVLIIAVLAGSYPAIVLSKFQPVKVLKGSFKNTASGNWLRKSLIVFQFAVSVILIISAIVIKNQLQFIQNKKLGYDRSHVVVMSIDQKLIEKIDLVKSELLSNPDILAVSKAYETPVKINGGYNMSGTDLSKTMGVTANPVDEDYIKATGMEIIAGTQLTKQDVTDASKDDYTKNYFHFILNESAAKALGWKAEEAIGKKMYLDETRPGEVKAVVKDFHFASLHNPIGPVVLFPGGWGNTLIVKTSGNNLKQTLAFIETKWKALSPHRPIDYRFMDEDYQKLYDTEMRTGKVFNIFSIIAILLACIGLFGLSAYAAKQRIKEIGVRKVLGASVVQIIGLLSASFLKLVFVSFIIAAPVTWLMMNKWLQGFSYRTDLVWWIFGAAGLLSLVIAFVTVSVQAVKAAAANPVKSLRTE